MTETTTTRLRLERPRDAGVRGVCTALARATGTDVVLWRVLAVVLTLFNGLGIVLYLTGIVTIPREGQPQSLADRLLHGPDRRVRPLHVVLLVALGLALAGLVSDTDGVLVVAVLAGLAVLWWRGLTDGPVAPTAVASHVTAAAVGSAAEPLAPMWVPPPPRPRSPFGGLTVAAAALVSGLLMLLGVGGDVSVPAEVVIAAALGVVGLGLAVGAWWGRSSGLVVVAVLLGIALGATAAARPALDAGVGERTWQPVSDASYRLGVGDATLDLRSLPVGDGVTVSARVDVGHLLVLLPPDPQVVIDARTELGGELDLLGNDVNGRRVHQHLELGNAPWLHLDLEVRAGRVEVRHG